VGIDRNAHIHPIPVPMGIHISTATLKNIRGETIRGKCPDVADPAQTDRCSPLLPI